jgi:hypothetical protein
MKFIIYIYTVFVYKFIGIHDQVIVLSVILNYD